MGEGAGGGYPMVGYTSPCSPRLLMRCELAVILLGYETATHGQLAGNAPATSRSAFWVKSLILKDMSQNALWQLD